MPTPRKRRASAARTPRKIADAQPQPATVWVSWESADGATITQAKLHNLDNRGYVELATGADTLWIPQRRVFSISTQPTPQAEAAVLEQETAAEAAAIIEAVAEGAKDEGSV